MDMYTGKFIGLVEEKHMRIKERFGKNLAELEAKWEEKLQSQQNTESAKRKVADTLVASETTENAIANWMEAGDAATTYVIQGRAERRLRRKWQQEERQGLHVLLNLTLSSAFMATY